MANHLLLKLDMYVKRFVMCIFLFNKVNEKIFVGLTKVRKKLITSRKGKRKNEFETEKLRKTRCEIIHLDGYETNSFM